MNETKKSAYNSAKGGRGNYSAPKKNVQSVVSGTADLGQKQKKITYKSKSSTKQNSNTKSNTAITKKSGYQSRGNKTSSSSKTVEKSPIKIIPLGGLGEIGKNITLYEYEGDMLLVDCGMSFPDEDTPGIDIVIPDFTYILENKDKIKGLVVTHGHEDHIGAIPYLLRNLNLPIYATRLTIGLISGKLKEHKLLNGAHLNEVAAGQSVTLGKFKVEFIHVNHSIPDAVGFAISCKAGTIVQTDRPMGKQSRDTAMMPSLTSGIFFICKSPFPCAMGTNFFMIILP